MSGIIIRSAGVEDAQGIAQTHIDSWRTTYKDIVPAAYLASLSYEKREEIWMRRLSKVDPFYFAYVATDEYNRVVGFVNGGKPQQPDESEYSSELYAIYLLKDFQGQGLGRRLMLQLHKNLIQAHLYSMFLWVLKDNPACHFYEAMGGRAFKTQVIEIGGKILDEIAYGWHDIRSFHT